jgi:hypothetical protein
VAGGGGLNLRHYPSSFLEGPRKTTKILCHVCRCLGRHSNRSFHCRLLEEIEFNFSTIWDRRREYVFRASSLKVTGHRTAHSVLNAGCTIFVLFSILLFCPFPPISFLSSYFNFPPTIFSSFTSSSLFYYLHLFYSVSLLHSSPYLSFSFLISPFYISLIPLISSSFSFYYFSTSLILGRIVLLFYIWVTLVSYSSFFFTAFVLYSF